MSQQWKMVPVEPTEEMIAAVEGDSYTFATGDEEWIGCLSSDMAEEIYSNMLAAAPVLPAGGEQGIRTIVTESLLSMVSAVVSATPPVDQPLPDFIQSPIDRAVTRISAHITGLQGERDQYCRMYDSASGALCAIGEALGVDEDDQSTCASLEAIQRLQAENAALQQRLTVADQTIDDMVTLLNIAENTLAEQRQISPGYDWINNTRQDHEKMRKQIAEYLINMCAPSVKIDCGNCAFVDGVCATGCETKRIRGEQP